MNVNYCEMMGFIVYTALTLLLEHAPTGPEHATGIQNIPPEKSDRGHTNTVFLFCSGQGPGFR